MYAHEYDEGDHNSSHWRLHENQFHFNFFSIFPFRQAKDFIQRDSLDVALCLPFHSRSSTFEIFSVFSFEVEAEISHQQVDVILCDVKKVFFSPFAMRHQSP